MLSIETRIKAAIRDVPDFPQPGILFKDITPILLDPKLCSDIVDAFIDALPEKPDIICAVESRGFFFGTLLANKMAIPFVPIRKKGKLPGDTVEHSYDLEYGSATIEIHKGVLSANAKVLIHDDLIATGGTVSAAAELVLKEGGQVAAFSFLIDLTFLNGKEKLKAYTNNIVALVEY
ncbi:MAG: adenine phosphoribosyltransferase [Chitinophagales bacterium]|nr:adenine phosphoribosyltransferase [Chitinophagales bacterium]